ncbi:recombinase family protein, partial [Intestinimonas butyriciproducens]
MDKRPMKTINLKKYYYQDDGYTGLNMERPDLKRMLKAIERKQVNLVITKDL